jgi:polysulfide reductase-like protein
MSRGRGEAAMVPRAEPASYYGRPVIKPPVWSGEVPWYLFAGGLAGASAVLGAAADAAGNRPLARRAWLLASAGLTVSPPLLVTDLGRPERFLNMMRVFKVTSPMSMGSWILAASGGATSVATVHELFGWFGRLGPLAKLASTALGPALATYTGVLVADTAVPAWHEARRELPFVFAGSAMASAGAASGALTPRSHAGPARRLTLGGAALELGAAEAMMRRLGGLAEVYRTGRAGRFAQAARALTAAGAALVGARGRRSRGTTILGGSAVLAGAVCQRWAVFEAGRASATDPKYTVTPQRERLATSDEL